MEELYMMDPILIIMKEIFLIIKNMAMGSKSTLMAKLRWGYGKIIFSSSHKKGPVGMAKHLVLNNEQRDFSNTFL